MSKIKNAFGQYFPEILNLTDDIQDADVTMKIGKKDFQVKIEDGVYVYIEKLPTKFIEYLDIDMRPDDLDEPFSFDQFLKMFEGYDQKDARQQMISSIKRPPKYVMADINKWTNGLFDQEGINALKFLKDERGLSEKSIREYKIGYDSKKNEIIVPYINFTGEGIADVKKYTISEYGNSFESEMDPPQLLLGYHELINLKYSIGNIILASDELEAILLRQLGFNSIGPFDSNIIEWLDMLKQFHILIYREQDIYTYDWNIDNAFKKIPLSLSLVNIGADSISDLIMKIGADKRGLEEKIEERVMVNATVYRSYLNLTDLRGYAKYTKSDFSQTYYWDMQYYGLVGEKELHMVSSNRMLENASSLATTWELANHELQIPSKPMSNFSDIGVQRYTTENYTPSSITAFNLVKSFLKDFMYFQDDETYSFISIWVMGTYLFKNFDYYPYMHINAPKGSGKSTLLDVLSDLCFNSKFYVDPSPAVVFREIELYQPTILFDEVEDFKNNSSKRELLSLLNQGFSKRSSLPRVSGKDITYYNMYCPKAFASINKINDVLLSRSIKVNMAKKPKSYPFKNSYKDSALINRIQEICDEIYIFGLYYAKEINDKYKNIKNLNELNDVYNREMDTWAPVFSIAQLIDKNNTGDKTVTELRKYLESDRASKKEEMDSSENEIAHFLNEYFQSNKSLRTTKNGAYVFDIDQLFNTAKKKKVLPKGVDSTNKLTTFLKINFNFDNPTTDIDGKKKRCYTFKLEELVNRFVEFGVNVTEEDFNL